jgi:hypothetical protein
MKLQQILFLCIICVGPAVVSAEVSSDSLWDISASGAITTWDEISGPLGHSIRIEQGALAAGDRSSNWSIGMVWLEERDVQAIKVVHESPLSLAQTGAIALQYWFNSWPEPPPHMPSVEDQFDDPWQGQWLTAHSRCVQNSDTLSFVFSPLRASENPNAPFLPKSVSYRRTLKVRLVYPFQPPALKAFHCFASGKAKELSVLIQFYDHAASQNELEGHLEVFNGQLAGLKKWHWQDGDLLLPDHGWQIKPGAEVKGIVADLVAADPVLPGSNDQTIVTVARKKGTFSFACQDLFSGPIDIPAFHARITLASDSVVADKPVKKALTIRQKLRLEPEQSFERSRREIPALNPVDRDRNGIGDRLYLPLSADASWQKFGLEWGGNLFMNKKYTRLKGNELKRCMWPGDVFRWEFGTGVVPEYQRQLDSCRMSVLNDYLPVVTAAWSQEGLLYEEESFASLPQSPLSPRDRSRDEQSPAVLYLRFTIANPTNQDRSAHLWCKGDPVSGLYFDNGFLYQSAGPENQIRLFIHSPGDFKAQVVIPQENNRAEALHLSCFVPANASRTIYVQTPFVSDLTPKSAPLFTKTDYDSEKNRVIDYWRDMVSTCSVIKIPEAKFEQMAQAVIPHIQIGVFKDPGSGLYMVPAAALRYYVYANESCFQMLLLDRMGAHDMVSDYLETFIRLQGSKPLPGAFAGDQNDVYYGARIDSIYDYTATGYNLHHGTVLWMMGQHYLLSRDNRWLQHAAPSMRRAADWIIAQRQLAKKPGSFNRGPANGLLPAGRLEDNREWGQWFSVNAYAWLGVDVTGRAFKQAGIESADYYLQEAEAYLKDLRGAVTRAVEYAPVVRLRDGTFVPYVPTRSDLRFRGFDRKLDYFRRYDPSIKPMLRLSATREILYGPMILLNTGVIQPQEQTADWILDDWEDNLTLSSSLGLPVHGWVKDEKWFSQGGMVFQANLQNPIQAYLQRQEIPAALRHLYNAMVSCLYPDVNAFTEEYRMWVSGSGPFYKSPDEARFVQRVLDLLVLETAGELWLAAGTPRRWLEPGQVIEVKDLATVYGPVSYVLKHGDKARTIQASLHVPFWQPPAKLKLYIRSPFAGKMKKVLLNGKSWLQWDAAKEEITLPAALRDMNLLISY